jgi:hypothetical protein
MELNNNTAVCSLEPRFSDLSVSRIFLANRIIQAPPPSWILQDRRGDCGVMQALRGTIKRAFACRVGPKWVVMMRLVLFFPQSTLALTPSWAADLPSPSLPLPPR